MKPLNKKTSKIFNTLIEGLEEPGTHKKLDAGGEFIMPVSIEHLHDTGIGQVYSVTHYYKLNGDLMRDPDMTFLKHRNGHIYPMSYQQDNLGIYQEVLFLDSTGWKVRQKEMRELSGFAKMWMKNIADQQGLTVPT